MYQENPIVVYRPIFAGKERDYLAQPDDWDQIGQKGPHDLGQLNMTISFVNDVFKRLRYRAASA